jgi:hypothetical protein
MTAQEALELWEAYGDCVSLPQLFRDMGLTRLIDRRRETSQLASHAPAPETPDSANANKDLDKAA